MIHKINNLGIRARDIMDDCPHTLLPQTPIVEAIKVFKQANRGAQPRVFGLMVIDEQGRLVGMLSMHDVLLLIRPKHIRIWGDMNDEEAGEFMEQSCRRAKDVLVRDVMTTNIITVNPNTHLLMVVDTMIKKHIRRVPVVENGRVLGIVYLSRVFHHLMEWMVD